MKLQHFIRLFAMQQFLIKENFIIQLHTVFNIDIFKRSYPVVDLQDSMHKIPFSCSPQGLVLDPINVKFFW